MAGVRWFKVTADFCTDPKTERLALRLRDPNAGMYVIRLFAYCATHALSGRFDAGPETIAMIERAMGWKRARGKLIEALGECGTSTESEEPEVGFIELEGATYVVHGWETWNGASIRKALNDSRKPAGNRPHPPRIPPTSPENPARDNAGKEPLPTKIPSTSRELPAGQIRSEEIRSCSSNVAAAGFLSPAEARGKIWPLTDRFAQQLGEVRGLTACPLSLPKRENRDRFEYLLSQTTVALAVQVCWPEWQNATCRGERVTSLGFFLRVLEQVSQAPPPPGPIPWSNCEQWNTLLEEASMNGGRELVQRWLSRLSPSIEGEELLLTAPDEYTAAFVEDLHLRSIREAAQVRFGLHVRLCRSEGPVPTVGGAP